MRVTSHLIRLTAAIGCLLLSGLFNAGAAIEKSPKFETDGLFLQSLPASGIARLIGEADSTTGTTTYAYDAAHNRIAKRTGAVETLSTYNAANQLTEWTEGSRRVTYTYDANGNRLTRSEGAVTDTFRWDAENRLISLTKQSPGGSGNYVWDYDYRTRRVGFTRPGMGRPSRGSINLLEVGRIRVIFSGGTSVREIEDGVPTVDYVRGSDWGGGVGGILYTVRNGTPSFTHYNSRGDVVAKTNGNGTVTYQASYEGFGLRQAEWGSTPDRQKSNTKDEDIPGYANEGHRFRDLETGAFISKDPLGFVDGPNVYAYVVQNPWTKFDPEGLWAEDLFIALPSIAIGAKSFYDNVRSGNVGGAVLDGVGIVADAGAAALPGVPGGAGLAIKATRAGIAAANKVDNVANVAQGAAATVDAAASGDVVGALSSGAQTALGAKSSLPGGKTAKATQEETQAAVHANAKQSTKAQHGYKIEDTSTGEIQEYGISSQKLKSDGTSPRVDQKVRTKYGGDENIQGEVIKTNMAGREKGLNWEQGKVNAYTTSNPNNQPPPKQYRPTPKPVPKKEDQ